MRYALAAAMAAVVLLLAGCASTPTIEAGPVTGPAKIDVDTPQLRELKKQAGVEACAPGAAGAVAGGLPAVTLPCLGGGPEVDLSTLRGPMVVNLWASWCGPCRAEMPILQGFHEKYGDQVAVLGVDYQDPQTVGALDLVLASGVTYPLLADPQGALSGADPFPALTRMPFLAFVDADGAVVGKVFNEIDSEDEMIQLANHYLGTDL